jgi:hypothetical protein
VLALTLLVAVAAQPYFTPPQPLVTQVKLYRYPKTLPIDPRWEVEEAERSSLVLADVKLPKAMTLETYLLHIDGVPELDRIKVDASGREVQRIQVALPVEAERLLMLFKLAPNAAKASVCKGTTEDCTAELAIETKAPPITLLPLRKAKVLSVRRVSPERFAVLVEWTNLSSRGNAFDVGLREESGGTVERGWDEGFEVDRALKPGRAQGATRWWLYTVRPRSAGEYAPKFATTYRGPHTDDELPLPSSKVLDAMPPETLARCSR